LRGTRLKAALSAGGHRISVIGTLNEPNRFNDVTHRSHAELIAEAEQAFTAAKRLVDEQTPIVRRLERTGGCNSEAVDLLNNLRELLAARERRLARVRSWPSWVMPLST
jgi:hypothetical protein